MKPLLQKLLAFALLASASSAALSDESGIEVRLDALKTEWLEMTVAADTASEPPVPIPAIDSEAPDEEPRTRNLFLDRLVSDAAALQARYRPDARLSPARHLLEQGQPFSAARELQRLGRELARQGLVPPPEWPSLLARSLVAYGSEELAQRLFEVTPAAVTIDARIALAQLQFRQGRAAAALSTLAALPSRLDATAEHDALLLKALILSSQGDDKAAAKQLARIQPDPTRLLTAPPAQEQPALLPQYNLGIALLRSGQAAQGRGLLDRIGRHETSDAAVLALRDQANLVLGWQFLREAQGATARPVFERVSLEGPFSNRALLGLGWAALAPQGRGQGRDDIAAAADTRETPKFVLKYMQRRKLINCEEYNRLSRAPQELCEGGTRFDQAVDAKATPGRIAELALAPWIELQSRDPEDPAVQESWTALPHALARVGAISEAQHWYETAVTRLEAARNANEQKLAHVREQGLRLPERWQDPAGEPSAGVSAAQLFEFLHENDLEALHDSPELIATLANLLDLLWLQEQQPDPNASAPDAMPEGLSGLRIACEAQLRQSALNTLEGRRTALDHYLEAARSGLAALYDPGTAQPHEVR